MLLSLFELLHLVVMAEEAHETSATQRRQVFHAQHLSLGRSDASVSKVLHGSFRRTDVARIASPGLVNGELEASRMVAVITEEGYHIACTCPKLKIKFLLSFKKSSSALTGFLDGRWNDDARA